MRSDTRVAILKAIERLLLLIAIVALGWYAAVRVTTIVQQARDNQTLERSISARGGVVRSDAVERTRPAPARLEPDAVIGRIDVPRLGISAIVREGTGDDTLERAVGHVADTPLPGMTGNAALAAHRDTFFRNLKRVRRGDRIVITTPERTVTYRVRNTRIVAPTDVSVLDDTPEPMLTLITCYPFNYIGSAPKRFIVHAIAEDAELLPAKPIAAAALMTSHALPGDGAKVVRAKSQKKVAAARAKKAASSQPEKKRGFWSRFGRALIGR